MHLFLTKIKSISINESMKEQLIINYDGTNYYIIFNSVEEASEWSKLIEDTSKNEILRQQNE